MKFKDKKILITGGTSGIGKEILKDLATRGAHHFAVMARNADRIESLKDEFPDSEILPLPGDISNPKDLDKAISRIESEWGELDILVNNAGVVSAGAFHETSDDDIINQVDINLTGVLLLTKRCLPLLLKSPEAAIVNVSSGLGYIAWPFYAVYATTKAGLRQFSDALRREYHMHPLHVLTVYPTATDTAMMDNAEVEKMDDAAYVAQKSMDGLANRERDVIFGGEQRLIDIEANFSQPEVIDKKAEERYDGLQKRTANHRSM
ncbi:MAG TPA: SDR family oxidoreductase [Cryomorphaceae bacterium]|nr:SDR family oxidoreductase [Cryomorphaceae bacterium]